MALLELYIFILGVDCGEPEGNTNAMLVTENPSYRFPFSLEYACANSGDQLCFGSQVITCQSDGQWSGLVPVCSKLSSTCSP